MRKIKKLLIVAIFFVFLVFNLTIELVNNSSNDIGLLKLQTESAVAQTEDPPPTKYWASYCDCKKSNPYEFCNIKTICIKDSSGNLTSCSSTNCNTGCSC